MTHLSSSSYSILRQIFQILDFSKQKQDDYINRFDQALMTKFIEATAKKLPPQERKPLINLANASATNKQKRNQLKKKLHFWFNENEIEKLFKKTMNQLFSQCLKNAYQQATPSQKQKLEKFFKPQALK